MTRKFNTIALAAALFVGASSLAQAQSTSGNIQGQAVTGETIVIDGVGNGYHREMKIEQDGKFSIRRVPTGNYVVARTRADGTAEAPKPIQIHAGVTVRID